MVKLYVPEFQNQSIWKELNDNDVVAWTLE